MSGNAPPPRKFFVAWKPHWPPCYMLLKRLRKSSLYRGTLHKAKLLKFISLPYSLPYSTLN
eukprot:1153388-Pelagomonas_calceolata.AAC.2